MLLNSTQVVPRSQHEEESALLRCKIVELNWNTIRLIAEAEKLIQESKQLSVRIKSFENAVVGYFEKSRMSSVSHTSAQTKPPMPVTRR
jgi:hypothetical protein